MHIRMCRDKPVVAPSVQLAFAPQHRSGLP